MRDHSQPNGSGTSFPGAGPAAAAPRRGIRAGLIGAVLFLALLPANVRAQSLRLGLLELTVTARGDVVYDSNVDGVYPEGEMPGLYQEDMYLMPGLMIGSQAVPMRPNTTFNANASLSYMDYFKRNDLDTELYSANVNFQTVHPRLTLGGMAGTEYAVEGAPDEYMPGGVSRDPTKTDTFSGFLNWNYWIVRVETRAETIRERHDYEMFQMGDNDETTLTASAYLDVFTWGSLYATWEKTTTLFIQSGEEKDETTTTLGLSGSVPFSLLRRPRITYSIGISSEQEEVDGVETEEKWEPTHTLTVADEYQLTKSINLAGTATWQNTPSDEEVSFLYDIRLTQLLGTHAEHSLSFSQEPQPTFGSTTETETTTYSYRIMLHDLLMRNLSMSLETLYEESTPLEEVVSETEKTSTVTLNISHARQLTRKLNRLLSYVYTIENSNFHHHGPNEKHLLTYGFAYTF